MGVGDGKAGSRHVIEGMGDRKFPSSGESVGDAGFRDAWEIALEMSVSHTVSMDSRLLLTC